MSSFTFRWNFWKWILPSEHRTSQHCCKNNQNRRSDNSAFAHNICDWTLMFPLSNDFTRAFKLFDCLINVNPEIEFRVWNIKPLWFDFSDRIFSVNRSSFSIWFWTNAIAITIKTRLDQTRVGHALARTSDFSEVKILPTELDLFVPRGLAVAKIFHVEDGFHRSSRAAVFNHGFTEKKVKYF